MTHTHPLQWPLGRKRTPEHKRLWGQFDAKRTRPQAAEGLMEELRKLGAKNVVLSSNLAIRQDGLPYTKQPRSATNDQGVAVYFDLNGRQMCFACDQFIEAAANLWAIKLTIEAIRGIGRWGASDMMEQAFTGFQALPASTVSHPNYFAGCMTKAEIDARYRELAIEHHPDAGGDAEVMAEINRQRDDVRERLHGDES